MGTTFLPPSPMFPTGYRAFKTWPDAKRSATQLRKNYCYVVSYRDTKGPTTYAGHGLGCSCELRFKTLALALKFAEMVHACGRFADVITHKKGRHYTYEVSLEVPTGIPICKCGR